MTQPAIFAVTENQGKSIFICAESEMYGLKHCIYYHCVVNGSNNMAESDAQPLHLCPVCLRKLHFATGFDLLQRYDDLHAFYQRADLEREAAWIQDRHTWVAGSKDPLAY